MNDAQKSRLLRWVVGSIVAVVAFGLLGALSQSREFQRVFVENFPAIQEIRGEVKLAEPLDRTTMEVIGPVLVSPVARGATTRLIEGGAFDASGFPALVLSVAGEVKGEVTSTGVVGAVLLPDEDLPLTAFREKAVYMFPLEVTAALPNGSKNYFFGQQSRFDLGFDRYRVFFYNSTDRSLEVTLYAYLTE